MFFAINYTCTVPGAGCISQPFAFACHRTLRHWNHLLLLFQVTVSCVLIVILWWKVKCVWSVQNCCSVSWALPVICSAALAVGSLPLDSTGNEYLEENSPAAWRDSCWKSRMKACPGFLPMEVIKGHCLPGTPHSQHRHFCRKQNLP